MAKDILERSRRNNEAADLTGLLLFSSGSFMQALEGPHDALQAAFERIEKDPRHHGLITLLDREVPARAFPDWSMGWQHLSPEDPLADQVKTVTTLQDLPRTGGVRDAGVEILITSFLSTNARPIMP